MHPPACQQPPFMSRYISLLQKKWEKQKKVTPRFFDFSQYFDEKWGIELRWATLTHRWYVICIKSHLLLLHSHTHKPIFTVNLAHFFIYTRILLSCQSCCPHFSIFPFNQFGLFYQFPLLLSDSYLISHKTSYLHSSILLPNLIFIQKHAKTT